MPSGQNLRRQLFRRAALLTSGLVAATVLPGQGALAAGNAQLVTVSTDQAYYQAGEGKSSTITLTVATGDGKPLATETTLAYRTGTGTASAGADYTAVAGTVTFAKGSHPGTGKTISVALRRDRAAETAETIPVTLTASTAGATVASAPTVVINANGLSYLDPRLSIRWRVADLISRMSLDDKVGQMTQAERAAVADEPAKVAELRLGSVLSGGGSVPAPNTLAGWVSMVNTLQRAAMSLPLQIPIIYGVDAVHGHGNVHGATVFAHNIGLGATRDPNLVERVYHATAAEVRATGIPWNFAPCVCVSRDERWGRTYESFGEDPALVSRMTTAVAGLQGRSRKQLDDPDRVLATVKHYAGDGDTRYGTGSGDYAIDQGVTVSSRAAFARTNLPPYLRGIRAGAGSVMPSFSSVDFTDDGEGNPVKMHAHRDLLTGTLKGKLGFKGFVISDWEGIHQLPDPTAPAGAAEPTAGQVRVAVNAGVDMFMEPNTAPQFEALLKAEVTAGRISMARIDDAVSRILTSKFEVGLFDQPYASTARTNVVGSAQHRAIGREAVAKSQVLLKNTGSVLPLRPDAKIYVAGRNADNIGNQAGGWTLDWQGRSGDTIPGTTILDGIRQVAPRAQLTFSADASAPITGADVGVVVVGETPYAEGYGDVGGPAWPWGTDAQQETKALTLQPSDKAAIDKVCDAVAKCVVLVVSGRPQILTDQLGKIEALVASWLPGSEGTGVADVLFGKRPFTGRLPMTWPASVDQVPTNAGDKNYQPLYPYGWGLRTGDGRDRLADAAGRRPSAAMRALLTPAHWDGATLRASTSTVRLAEHAFTTTRDATLQDELLAVLHDTAQARMTSGSGATNGAAVIADADRAHDAGRTHQAVTTLTRFIGS
ncbi:glycoside hydrolase family 3 N-terminal domain-containing protein [Actinoplanes aureus]|uniref:beta-glucosidase n=1 Tax=Actinoplanes aureus TaxID=2792083 RepID=A0A931G3R2_9ACTN|nr:glycoside hydrolase family 3 N-terminal domain-containing protein [Actinoplanes aureus]MBG0569142.1 glycoside hydrolase family 3 C-terminal domain-containing protein [Actinoplanes aureus]